MWKKVNNNIVSIQHDEEPWVIHIIKTGFSNLYFVVHEDAYEELNGLIDYLTKEQVEEQFKIKLD